MRYDNRFTDILLTSKEKEKQRVLSFSSNLIFILFSFWDILEWRFFFYLFTNMFFPLRLPHEIIYICNFRHKRKTCLLPMRPSRCFAYENVSTFQKKNTNFETHAW